MNAMPHPDLHLHLARLRTLSGQGNATPIFGTSEDAVLAAECLTEETGRAHHATPVWWIEPRDVQNSVVIAWTTTATAN